MADGMALPRMAGRWLTFGEGEDTMSFTIEDTLLTCRDRFGLQLAAGRNGWSNSIQWVLLVEDTTVLRNFTGKELAVTTGFLFRDEARLMHLLTLLHEHHCSGLVVSIGEYISELPPQALRYCDENDLPLMTIPLMEELPDLVKDLDVQIILQSATDELIVNSLIRAIESPAAAELAAKELLPYFDVDGSFQILLITTGNLDSMDSVERRRIDYRLALYLENISHNSQFFYYNNAFILVMNAVPEDKLSMILDGFRDRLRRLMPDYRIYVGLGSRVTDLKNLSTAYLRARAAIRYAMDNGLDYAFFDEMGLYRMLYTMPDADLLSEMSEVPLAPLISYDKAHDANYLETLECYLACDGSYQAMARAMYTHRNTIMYRMNNIRQLLGCRLETTDERLPYQIACMIRHMKRPQGNPLNPSPDTAANTAAGGTV